MHSIGLRFQPKPHRFGSLPGIGHALSGGVPNDIFSYIIAQKQHVFKTPDKMADIVRYSYNACNIMQHMVYFCIGGTDYGYKERVGEKDKKNTKRMADVSGGIGQEVKLA